MKANILIIEDVREMGELIRLYLEKEGAQTRLCESAEQGMAALAAESFDLLILDLNLPGIDGFQFLQRLRKDSEVPVIIVSARDADEDVILGLGIGADEFVTKPFSPKVLVARVRAMLRRATEAGRMSTRTIRFGAFTLDLDACLLKRDARRVPLSSREFEVLACLATHAGKALRPQTIYAEVWKNEYGDVTAVGVYVQRLRRKIEEDPAQPRIIETIPGMGYRFNREGAAQGGTP
jgi:DNA-binding response OmpR family regulator